MASWSTHMTYCPLFGVHMRIYPYIFPSFPSFLPSFRKSSPLLQQPMGLWTWISVCGWVLVTPRWFLVNHGQRSKVKVKNPQIYVFSGPVSVTGAMYGAIQDQGGSGGVPLPACQLILATCQKLENDGIDRFPSIGKAASVAGKVPKLV